MAPTIRGLGAVQPVARAAAEEIASRFQIYNIGGFASSGHIANSDHYKGLAIDVMTGPNPSAGKGEMVAQFALANAQRLGVKYIIWNRRYNGLDGKGWVPYTGTSPHTDHVHISFNAQAGSGPIVDSGASAPDEQARGCLVALAELFGIKL